jgi:hypothetical protein
MGRRAQSTTSLPPRSNHDFQLLMTGQCTLWRAGRDRIGTGKRPFTAPTHTRKSLPERFVGASPRSLRAMHLAPFKSISVPGRWPKNRLRCNVDPIIAVLAGVTRWRLFGQVTTGALQKVFSSAAECVPFSRAQSASLSSPNSCSFSPSDAALAVAGLEILDWLQSKVRAQPRCAWKKAAIRRRASIVAGSL